jgi:hypothetical protein
VQSVPAPSGLTRPALAFAAALLAALAVTLAFASALDSPSSQPEHKANLYRGVIGGVPLQSAHCAQWNAGTAAERNNVADALAWSVGGGTPYGPGTTLSTSEAHNLFDRACSNPIAQNWLLYELYIRAAGFRSYAPR